MLPDLKTMLVVNPHAGGGRGRRIFPAVRKLLGQGIGTMDLRVSEHAGHAFAIGRTPLRLNVLPGELVVLA